MNTLNVTEYHCGTGAGTLVLLHGFPVDSRMWDATASLLDAAWHVIGIDLPGLGRSADVLPETPSMDASAGQVHEALGGHVTAGNPLVLAGLSMGGYVAQSYVRQYPGELAGLVLLDTRATADTDDARTNRLKIADESEKLGTSAPVAGMATGTLSQSNAAERPELVAMMTRMIESQRASGVAWSQRAMAARGDSTEVLSALDIPALIVVGEDDHVSPVDVMTDIAGSMKHASLKIIPDAGHMSPVEQPDLVAEAINQFLHSKFQR